MTAKKINEQLKEKRVFTLEEKIYNIDETIYIPSETVLKGEGDKTVLSTDKNIPVISFENVKNASVKNLKIVHSSTKKTNYGIKIWGENIKVSDIWIENSYNGIYLKKLKDSKNKNIILKNIKYSHSKPCNNTSQFGLQVNSVENLTVENSHWRDAWLDGIKLTYHCKNINIIGGSSNFNGQIRYCTKKKAGDGIDCFAGGENVTIDGTEFSNNGGNGIVIKTKGKNTNEPDNASNPEYGQVQNYCIKNVTCKNNKGSGLSIEGVYDFGLGKNPHLKSKEENCRDRASNISTSKSTFNGNVDFGIFINGENIKVMEGECLENKRTNIQIAQNSNNVYIKDTKIGEKEIVIEEGAKNIIIK